MAVTASKKVIYAGDDLVFNLVWKTGTAKTPGDPVNITGYTFVANLLNSANSAVVTTGTVTTVPLEGKIKISLSETQTNALVGNYELRLKYTDTNSDTLTFMVMPVEVKK